MSKDERTAVKVASVFTACTCGLNLLSIGRQVIKEKLNPYPKLKAFAPGSACASNSTSCKPLDSSAQAVLEESWIASLNEGVGLQAHLIRLAPCLKLLALNCST